jgi:hypothetical protein
MQGSRPPHPPDRQRPDRQQTHPHPPVAGQQGERRNPPLLTEHDLELMKELLENEEQAQGMFSTLQNSPPELAALGFLMLKIYERTRA